MIPRWVFFCCFERNINEYSKHYHHVYNVVRHLWSGSYLHTSSSLFFSACNSTQNSTSERVLPKKNSMSYFHHLSPVDHLWLVCVAATQEVPWGTFPMPKMLLSKQNYCGDHHYQAKAVLTFDGFLNSGYTFESSNNCLNTTIWKTPSKEKHP